MMLAMNFSTNVSEFCYSDTGPSALPYRLTKSCTFRDSMERTENCIEETDVFIFSKHHIQLELDFLHLLGEAGDAESRVRHASCNLHVFQVMASRPLTSEVGPHSTSAGLRPLGCWFLALSWAMRSMRRTIIPQRMSMMVMTAMRRLMRLILASMSRGRARPRR